MVNRTEYNSGLIVYKNENGEFLGEDGPAIIRPDGTKVWYKNGKRHREDGPAMFLSDGTVFWYLNGVKYSFNKWREKVNISSEEKLELVLKYG